MGLTKEQNGLVESLQKEIARLQHVIDRDRYTAAHCVHAIESTMESRKHLREPGRGSYEWNDERYQQEFGLAYDEIGTSLLPMKHLAVNKEDCTVDPEEINAARAAGAEQFNLFSNRSGNTTSIIPQDRVSFRMTDTNTRP